MMLYIPDPQFRKRDVRFSDAGRHRRAVNKRKEKTSSWMVILESLSALLGTDYM
ncbi:MAG: hypothetical protein SWO11_20360 [Thermodesulfobacteriota bacterium]|nr:hypothetical protein [Thermodesulfobacteriota bacterium]